MSEVLYEYVDEGLFVLLISGLILFIYDDLTVVISRIQLRSALRSSRKGKGRERRSTLEEHITALLDVIPDNRMSAAGYIRLSVILSFAVLIITSVCTGAPVCFAAAVFSLAMPYVALRLRYSGIRSAVNDEREKLISTILSAYRMNNFNIEKALEYTAAQNKDLPHTSLLLSTMLRRLRECGDETDVRRVTATFAASAGFRWADMLAVNIRIAYVQGRDIHVTLEEQLKQIREADQLMRERLRSNNESIRMTTYLIPGSFVLMMFLSVRQMNMTLPELAALQFGDSRAGMMFMLIMALYVFNYAAAQLVMNRKTEL